MIIDVDYFKDVNDNYGHLFGDVVLKDLAKLLLMVCDKKDVVMRAGGDEFVILFKDIPNKALVRKAMQLVHSIRNQTFQEKEYSMTCSIGVCYLPENVSGYTYEQILKNADWALYRAKENGRDRYVFCDNLQRFQSVEEKREKIEEHKRGKRPISGYRGSLVATAFETFEKACDFDSAVNSLLEIVGKSFNLDRVTVLRTDIKVNMCEKMYQWTADNVPQALEQKISYKKEDFLKLFYSYDENGTTVLQKDEMKSLGYSEHGIQTLLHGDAKYFDVLERTLYNGLISGVSLDGGSFFYPNPLSSSGKYSRKPWFGCACCPSNVSRFIPSLPGYVYAVKDDQVYVNLFLSNKAELKVDKKKIILEQETDYPWKGDIRLKIAQGNQNFTMKLRIPGWVRGNVLPGDLYAYADNQKPVYRVSVNGQTVESDVNNGYLSIARKWKKGDVVEVHFDMLPRIVKANPKVEADRGRVAVERGPIVYCAEWPDNRFNIHSVLLNQHPQFKVTEKPELLYGINQLTTDAQALSYDMAGKLVAKDVELTLIPYYAWAHRGEGDMEVWLPIDVSATSTQLQEAGVWEDNGFFKN